MKTPTEIRTEGEAVRASLSFKEKMFLFAVGVVAGGGYWLLDPPWWLNVLLASITVAEYAQSIVLQIIGTYRAR